MIHLILIFALHTSISVSIVVQDLHFNNLEACKKALNEMIRETSNLSVDGACIEDKP